METAALKSEPEDILYEDDEKARAEQAADELNRLKEKLKAMGISE